LIVPFANKIVGILPTVLIMNLKQLREKLNMTQQEFADEIGIGRSVLSKYERGVAKIPTYIEKHVELYMSLHKQENIIKEMRDLAVEKFMAGENLKRIDAEIEQYNLLHPDDKIPPLDK